MLAYNFTAVAEANNIYIKSRELILNYIQESADSGQKAAFESKQQAIATKENPTGS